MIRRNQVIQGDALQVLRTLPDSSVDCVVTSPPYFNVRHYDSGVAELGQEAGIEGWVAHLRDVAAELARALTPSGGCWLNVGDVYARTPAEGAPPKSLLLGPERLIQALLADSWLVRNRVAWAKSNPMPSPAADRLSPSWEFVYFLVRSQRYFFDLDAIREPAVTQRRAGRISHRISHGRRDHGHSGLGQMQRLGRSSHPLGKNPGDWWRIGGSRHRYHPATFPAELIRRPILATCPEKVCTACGRPWERSRRPVRFAGGRPQPRPLMPCGCGAPTRPGLVLDPFLGSGTTARVAKAHGRDWLGIELNPAYVRLTERRLEAVG